VAVRRGTAILAVFPHGLEALSFTTKGRVIFTKFFPISGHASSA